MNTVDIRSIWKEFANRIGGDYQAEDPLKGKPYPSVTASRGGQALILNASDVPEGAGLKFTAVIGEYQGAGFEFVVRTGGWFNPVEKLLAKTFGDIQVGEPDFDKETWITGKRKVAIATLFKNKSLQEQISKLETCRLAQEHNSGGDGYQISFVDCGTDITCDTERLNAIFELCWNTLDQITKDSRVA